MKIANGQNLLADLKLRLIFARPPVLCCVSPAYTFETSSRARNDFYPTKPSSRAVVACWPAQLKDPVEDAPAFLSAIDLKQIKKIQCSLSYEKPLSSFCFKLSPKGLLLNLSLEFKRVHNNRPNLH